MSTVAKERMGTEARGAAALAASAHQEINGSVCFVSTGPPMLRLLTGTGPDAMGGAELQLSILARYLRANGWGVTFLVGDYGQAYELLTEDGIRVLKAYPQPERTRTLASTLEGTYKLGRSLADADADVYLCRGLTGQAGLVAAWCRMYRRRYMFWFAKNADALYGIPWKSSLPMSERLPATLGIAAADAVVLQTAEQGELLAKHFRRPGVLIRNVAPTVDATAVSRADGYVLWVGSIQPKKRPEMLLEIAASLPDVQFVMVGGALKNYPDLHKKVNDKAAELDNLDFRGYVPFEETEALFADASMLLSTSDGVGEGFPNVFLQAWAAGVPVVSTCDPDNVLSEHGAGRCFTSPVEGAGEIRRLLEAPEERAELGRRVREYVDEQHSIRRAGCALENVLHSLIDDGPVPVTEIC